MSKAMNKLLARQRHAMDHPPKKCERCPTKLTEYNRYWESHSGQWICDKCDEKVLPA